MIVVLLAGLAVLVLGGAAVAAFPVGGPRRARVREATAADERVLQDLAALDALLRLSGHGELAKALGDARTGSVQPGEVLNETREVLRRIRDESDAYRAAGVRERVDRLIADVNHRLGGPDRA